LGTVSRDREKEILFAVESRREAGFSCDKTLLLKYRLRNKVIVIDMVILQVKV
jgi:hypothetical protein